MALTPHIGALSGNESEVPEDFYRERIKCAFFRVSLLKQCGGYAIVACSEVHEGCCTYQRFMLVGSAELRWNGLWTGWIYQTAR